MDGLENRQALRHRLVVADEGLLVGSTLVLGLQLEYLRLVEVSVELVEAVVLVSEHAVFAVHAVLLRVECPAVFGLEHVTIARNGLIGELVLAMGEEARVLVAALGSLDPVSAKSGLEVAAGAGLGDNHLHVHGECCRFFFLCKINLTEVTWRKSANNLSDHS